MTGKEATVGVTVNYKKKIYDWIVKICREKNTSHSEFLREITEEKYYLHHSPTSEQILSAINDEKTKISRSEEKIKILELDFARIKDEEDKKSMEEENMEMKDIPLSQGYIDEIKKQISELGMDEKIKNLVETIKDVESEEDKIKIEAVQEEIRKLSWERKEGAVSKIDFFRYIKFLKGGQNA
jgi:hypothetical protein